MAKKVSSRTHLVIPDTQIRPGVPTIQLDWIGRYIVEKQPDVIVHLGDHWDMPSMSQWDKGKLQFEGRRYQDDIEVANAAFKLLTKYIDNFNKGKRPANRYNPRLVFLRGNHENRVERAIQENGVLLGKIGYHDMDTTGWEVHDFLEMVEIDGVTYSHYFYNPMTGRPYGGAALNRLKTIGFSFIMGHQQTLDYAIRFVGQKSHHGLVAGACYLHDEEYKGPQGNAHWRGIVMLHEVEGGSYDPMFVSLNFLCHKYEGVALKDFQS